MGILLQLWEWLQNQWVQSDLASWIAAVLSGVAAVLAWRALHLKSYLEILPGWTVKLDGNDVKITGKITAVSPAGQIGCEGSILELPKETVTLHLGDIIPGIGTHVQTVILKGKYAKELTFPCELKLKLKVRLSDKTTKQFKTTFRLQSTPDSEGSVSQ